MGYRTLWMLKAVLDENAVLVQQAVANHEPEPSSASNHFGTPSATPWVAFGRTNMATRSILRLERIEMARC
jgi:hypothetical protein